MSHLHRKTLAEIQTASLGERLEALTILWESLSDEEKNQPISETEKRILDYSLEYSSEHPESQTAWDSLKAELSERIGQRP